MRSRPSTTSTGCGSDLLTFTKTLCFDDELPLAEPRTLRHRLLHVAARIVHTGRRTYLRIAVACPWTRELVEAFARLDRFLPTVS